MRVFKAFLVMLTAVVLFMLPLTLAVYGFRTDLETDYFTNTTGVGENTANVVLQKAIYEDDTDTLTITSDLSTDAPIYSSYNATSRLLGMSGLTVSDSRVLTVSYDVDALGAGDGLSVLVDKLPWFLLLIVIAFPVAAIGAIFTNRA